MHNSGELNFGGPATADVRYGSKADIGARPRDVRFVPQTDILAAIEYNNVAHARGHRHEAPPSQIPASRNGRHSVLIFV